jgi:hypothetical protein
MASAMEEGYRSLGEVDRVLAESGIAAGFEVLPEY